MGRALAAWGALLLLIAAILLVQTRLLEPPPVRGAAVTGAFDTQRAFGRLDRILGDQRPHPVDTAASDAVRARLVAELEALGLEPEITDRFVCNGSKKGRNISCARVRNVIATIGPTEGEHLLFVSHYDSTNVGPGAADDGIGVATMLEVAAQLQGRRLERPVTFLFNEGEEGGLLGARLFLDRHPIARRVETLVNLESRGTEGPAIMFETNVPNGRAVSLLSQAAERPVANSMSTAFYRLIPNSTDVAVFEEAGWTTLNIAVIGNETRYHSPSDTLAALDRRSLQHMGDQALALATATAPAERGNKVFADLGGRSLLALPAPLALTITLALFLAAAVLAWRRREGVGRAALAIPLAMAAAAGLTFLAQMLVGLLVPGDFWRGTPLAIQVAGQLTALVAVIAALLWSARGPAVLRAAFWLVFLLLGTALAFALPGSAIFALLPPLPALAGMAIGRRKPGLEQLGAILSAALIIVVWTPLLGLMQITLDHDAMWLFAPLTTLILLPALIELKALIAWAGPRPVFAAAVAVALLAWIGTALAPTYTTDRKQAFGIEYVSYGSESGAKWMIVNDGAPLPEAFSEFEPGAKVPWSSRERWFAPAPSGLGIEPNVEMIGSAPHPEGRLVSLLLRTNGAETVTLRAPPSAEVKAVRAGGWARQMGGQDREETAEANSKGENDFTVRCHGRACDGMRVDLLLGNRKALDWTMFAVRSGLPPAAKPLLAARPATAAPQYTPDGLVGVRKFRL